jgi:hypothetical protein
MMSLDQETLSKHIYIFALSGHLTHYLEIFQHTLHTFVTALHHH